MLNIYIIFSFILFLLYQRKRKRKLITSGQKRTNKKQKRTPVCEKHKPIQPPRNEHGQVCLWSKIQRGNTTVSVLGYGSEHPTGPVSIEMVYEFFSVQRLKSGEIVEVIRFGDEVIDTDSLRHIQRRSKARPRCEVKNRPDLESDLWKRKFGHFFTSSELNGPNECEGEEEEDDKPDVKVTSVMKIRKA